MTNEEKSRLLLQEVEALDNKCLWTQQQNELQAWIFRAFNKKVKEQLFKKGDLVLALRQPMIMIHKAEDKFNPK